MFLTLMRLHFLLTADERGDIETLMPHESLPKDVIKSSDYAVLDRGYRNLDETVVNKVKNIEICF